MCKWGNGAENVNKALEHQHDGAAEWFVADFACPLNRWGVVGLATTLGLDDVVHIIANSGLACVVSTPAHVPLFLAARQRCPSLRLIIEIDADVTTDHDPVLAAQRLEAARAARETILAADLATVVSFVDVEAAGAAWLEAEGGRDPQHVFHEPDDIFTLIYTSGSTGKPKGAILPDRIWVKLVGYDLDPVSSAVGGEGGGFMSCLPFVIAL